MELSDYLHIVRRRWLLIVGCFVLAVAIAALVTFRTTPLYSSSARLFVTAATADTTNGYPANLYLTERVASYADLANSRELAARVIDELGVDLEPAELASRVEATVVPQTVNITVTVTDPDADTAQDLAQGVADGLAAYVTELETPPGGGPAEVKISVVDPASHPSSPSSPSPVRNLGLAAVLGLLLGLALAVLRETLEAQSRRDDVVVD